MSINKKNAIEFIVPLFFLTALFFVYPLFIIRLFKSIKLFGYFQVFNPEAVSLLALAGCLLYINQIKNLFKKNSGFLIAFGIIFSIALLNYFKVANYSADNFYLSLLWLTVPLFGCLYYKHLKILLQYFLITLWILNTWQCIIDLFFKNPFFTGISGNSNWNAAIIIITTPFIIHAVLKLSHVVKINALTVKIIKYTVCSLLLLVSLIFLYKASSKAANLALAAALAVLIIFKTVNLKSRQVQIIISAGFVAGIILLIAIVNTQTFANFAQGDVRLPLWHGALAVIKDHLLTGTSPAVFESSFARYIPFDYYLRGNVAAIRNNHPHNHLLFMAASFGILAFAGWCYLLFRPITQKLLDLKNNTNVTDCMYFFCIIVLLIHGMLDLTIYEWPCNYIFLLILGIFWHDTWASEKTDSNQNQSINPVGIILGTALLIPACYTAYNNGISSYWYRQTMLLLKNNQKLEAFNACNKSLEYKLMPQAIHRAAMIALFDMKNPELCLKYLDMFDITPYENYSDNNGLKARALCIVNRPREALEYFRRESEIHPLMSVNWYFYWQTLKALGLRMEAEYAYDKLIKSLRIKGMTIQHIPIILRNPELDYQYLDSDGKTPKITTFLQDQK